MNKIDARFFQILFLALALLVGVYLRDFSIHADQVALTFLAGLLTQAFFLRVYRLNGVGYKSAWITCTALSILLRADNLWVHPLTAAVAMALKFRLRIAGKHLFNPANLGVIFAWSLLPGAWISPGQWGQDLLLASWMAFLGLWVVQSADRKDISLAFLAFYVALLAIRISYLGQRWEILLHHLMSGSLLLFSFFMISDPMTTPNHRRARILFAGLVALIAFVWQFGFYARLPLFWALFLASFTVPVWDRWFPAPRYTWVKSGG